MKALLKTLPALAALITFADVATAQDGERRGPGRNRELSEREKQFDKNNDGRLSQEERQAMVEAREKETLAKYDANKDGKLDADERAKWRADVAAARRERGQGQGGRGEGRGPGGPGGRGGFGGGFGFGFGPEEVPSEEAIAKFDKDGNGMLNGEEVRAYAEARRKEMMEKYDTDKDGQLSREERQKMMEDRRKELEEAAKKEEKKD